MKIYLFYNAMEGCNGLSARENIDLNQKPPLSAEGGFLS
jgi:hypothetical protein